MNAEIRPTDAIQAAVSPRQFRRIMGAFPTGVTVVTAKDDEGQPVGLTANAVSSVSLEPPQLLVCLGRDKYTCAMARKRGRFAVNFLAEEQRWIAERLASPAADKFSEVPLEKGALDLPLIGGALAHAECRIEREIEAGDHVVLIGRVSHGEVYEGGPLMFYSREYGRWPGAAAE